MCVLTLGGAEVTMGMMREKRKMIHVTIIIEVIGGLSLLLEYCSALNHSFRIVLKKGRLSLLLYCYVFTLAQIMADKKTIMIPKNNNVSTFLTFRGHLNML